PSPDGVPPPARPPHQGLPSYPQPPHPYAPQQPPESQQSYPQQPPPNPYATAGPYGQPYPGAQQQPFGYAAPGGQPGYPGQQGWYAHERTTNGMSIAALVVGLIPCVPVLGLIFGLVGLKQVKRRGERGKGMAVAGITLSSVWTLGLAALITLAAVGVFDGGNTQVGDLKAGQCFNTVGKKLSDYGSDSGTRSTSVDVVDCAEAHDAEAFAVYEIQSGADDPYPGVDGVTDDAQTNCVKYARTYLDGKEPRVADKLYFYLPPAGNWAEHERSVICFFGSPGGRVTGSVKSGESPARGTGVGV
ncbi:DUF4190 domain-containing protein, partial [Streptomyces sp. IBSBF 2435]|uniref:DUF4190 domain-containing protein n=1 Tax=Streptomyces sp. IBSBF 2435 TaxID=2903531 RepID=UPI002FDC10CB